MGLSEKTRQNDEKKLHLIDWLIMAFVMLLLLGGVWLVLRMRTSKGESIPVVFTLLLSDVSDDVAMVNGGWESLMPIGAEVTNERGSLLLGRVESLSFRPSLMPSVADGEGVLIERNGRVDLYVSVRADAVYREDDCYRVGDLPILCGTAGDWRIGSYLARKGLIVRLERVEEV